MRHSADCGPLIVLIEPRGLAISGMACHPMTRRASTASMASMEWVMAGNFDRVCLAEMNPRGLNDCQYLNLQLSNAQQLGSGYILSPPEYYRTRSQAPPSMSTKGRFTSSHNINNYKIPTQSPIQIDGKLPQFEAYHDPKNWGGPQRKVHPRAASPQKNHQKKTR